MAATKPEVLVGDPLEIELIAQLRVMQQCVPLGIPVLTVESDSMLAVKAFAEGED